MDPNEIRRLLRSQPFVPFRLYVLDGTTIDIKHPDELLLTKRAAHVPVPGGGDEVPERIAVISLLAISRLEQLPAGAGSGNGAV